MTDTNLPDVAAEIAAGDAQYLAAAAKLLPLHRGRSVAPSTLYRWATSGVRLPDGQVVRLETVRLSGKLVTSRAALARFLRRQTPAAEPASAAPARTPTKREREATAAQAELASKYGI